MKSPSRVIDLLIVEDNIGDTELVGAYLEEAGILTTTRHAETLAQAERALATEAASVVLLDLCLPDAAGLEVVDRIRKACPSTAIVVLTGFDDEQSGRRAIRAGAEDYVAKNHLSPYLLGRVITYALERRARANDERRLHERLFSFLENMPVAVFAIDAQGQPFYWNEGLRRMVGDPKALGADDIAGLLPRVDIRVAGSDAQYPLDQLPIMCALRGESKRADDIEVRGIGAPRILDVAASPVRGEDGEVEYAVAVFTDVTLQRTLERKLQQTQRMEAMGRLAGGIAHDFNNLLTAITVGCQLASESLPEGSTPQADIADSLQAAGRAADLTRQLLAFSKRQAIRPRRLDVNTVMRNLDGLLKRLSGHGVKVDADLTGASLVIEIDPTMFEQVIVNLVVNGRDAMHGEGTLTLSTEHRVDADGADWVVVGVRDEGHGMDDETMRRIFEPFFTTKAEDHGTGLGLATCYGIVSQVGGRIEVDSEVGVGSRFDIVLPKAKGAAEQVDLHPTERPAVRGTETVLLVEDDLDVRRLVVRVLNRAGYDVRVAADGAEALRIVEESSQSIDLLLADILMPKMSGLTLVDEAKKVRPDLSVLLISGYAGPSGENAVLRTDHTVLPKPFPPRALLEQVRVAIDAPA